MNAAAFGLVVSECVKLRPRFQGGRAQRLKYLHQLMELASSTKQCLLCSLC